MARERRGRGQSRGGRTAPRRLPRWVLVAVAFAVLVGSVAAGFYLRYLPYKNYKAIVHRAESYGMKDTAYLGYLGAMDPVIEYWMANYLHTHGLSSWSTLHPPNPAVMKFWYPWGRDFTHTAKPFVPMVGAKPPHGLSVVQWVSLLPPIFGAIMVAVAFFFMYSVYGVYAAIAAAVLMAVIPSAAIRTYAGFVEKTGIAMPFFIAMIWLYVEALRRDSYPLAIAAGVLGGLINLIWGGYLLAGLTIAVTTALAPIAMRERQSSLRKIYLGIAASAAFFVTLMALKPVTPVPTHYALLPLAATIVVLIVHEAVAALSRRIAVYEAERRAVKIYTAVIIIGGLAVFLGAPLVGIMGKSYYALLGPLHSIVRKGIGVIEYTVAENNPPSARVLVHRMNVILFTAPLAGAYLLYVALRRRQAWHLPLAVTSLGLYYALMGMAYFEQAAAVFGIIASAAMLGLLARYAAETPTARRRSRTASELEELRVFAAVLLGLVLLGGAIAGAHVAKGMMSAEAPIQLDMPSSYVQQYGWFYLLHYLKDKVPNNTVVVAWWDYGYLITVGSGKATVADGATINGTQIKLLAKFFTSTSEDEACKILRELHLKPNETLIFVHEAVLYDPNTGEFIYTPTLGDIAKSGAMLLIAGKAKFGESFPVEYYQKTMIYRMFVSAPFYASKIGVIFPKNLIPTPKGFKVTKVLVAGLGLKGKLYKFKHFKPYMLLLSPFITRNGRPIVDHVGGKTYYAAIAYVLYKWTG